MCGHIEATDSSAAPLTSFQVGSMMKSSFFHLRYRAKVKSFVCQPQLGDFISCFFKISLCNTADLGQTLFTVMQLHIFVLVPKKESTFVHTGHHFVGFRFDLKNILF